jgi:hypothetical protein
MKLCRKEIIGSFTELLEQANDGDMILLYEGEWDRCGWCSSPKGVIIRRDWKYLLNGIEDVLEHEFYVWRVHPQPDVIRNENQIVIEGLGVIYNGPYDWVMPHPNGYVIEKGNQLWLRVCK